MQFHLKKIQIAHNFLNKIRIFTQSKLQSPNSNCAQKASADNEPDQLSDNEKRTLDH